MLSQKCPRCNSKRVRRGYRPTSIFSKAIFRFNLLCDNCNWQFKGFALPGFKSPKQTRSSREKKEINNSSELKVEVQPETETLKSPQVISKPKIRKKNKIRI